MDSNGFKFGWVFACALGMSEIYQSQAADIISTWDGSGNNWSDIAHWDSNPLFPNNNGQTFDAIINNGTVTLDLDIEIEKFTHTGGVIAGDFDLTVVDLYTWTNGRMSGSSATNAEGGMTISGSGAKDLTSGRMLVNTGTATWTNGGIRTGGSMINNSGIWEDQNISGNGISNDFAGGPSVFNNTGTYRKSVGAERTSMNILFNNTGTVEVQSGTLDLIGGGVSSGSFEGLGTIRFRNDHTLEAGSSVTASNIWFSGVTEIKGAYDLIGTTTSTRISGSANFNAGASVGNIGNLTINGGTVNFNLTNEGPVIADTVTQLGALSGTADVTVMGLYTWTSGRMSGSGATNAEGGMTISGSGFKDLTRMLVNTGTATWTNGGIRTGGLSTTIDNSGTWEDQNISGNGIRNVFGGGVSTFNNSGLYRKLLGTETTTIDTFFNNTGTVEVQSGTLDLVIGGVSSGAWDVGSSAILQFRFGMHGLSSGSTIGGAGQVLVSGGTLLLGIDGTTRADGTGGFGQYSAVDTGSVVVNGFLEIDLGFTPLYGDVFKIVTADMIDVPLNRMTGDVFTLDNDTTLALAPVLIEGVTANDPDALTLITTAPGDANLDFKVDAADLNTLALNWQKSIRGWGKADFNNDGVVNAVDLNLLALNWQRGVAQPTTLSFDDAFAQALAAAVPEPGTAS